VTHKLAPVLNVQLLVPSLSRQKGSKLPNWAMSGAKIIRDVMDFLYDGHPLISIMLTERENEQASNASTVF
jgi:hypothetical protein